MDEPIIVINGHRLHTGHAMTVRVALQTFAFSLKGEGMGDDEHGRRMTQHDCGDRGHQRDDAGVG